MASLSNRPHQAGTALGRPAQYKERRLYALFSEQVQQALRITLDPERNSIPGCRLDLLREGSNLKVIFNVDCRRVAHLGINL